MKFNPQLKEQLNKYETICLHKGVPANDSVHEHQQTAREPDNFKLRARQPEKVVGGDVLWKPVDKIAARLIQKAPWWAFYNPPFVPPKPEPKKKKQKTKTPMKSMTVDVGSPVGGAHVNDPKQSTEKSDLEVSAEIVSNIYKKGDKSISECDKLVAKAMDARAALELMCNHWKVEWLDFTEKSDARMLWMRQTRMAFDTETRLLMAQLREVRQFFLDNNHAEEISRLKEFVELCERLKALKESGFLDVVADTMIKLA